MKADISEFELSEQTLTLLDLLPKVFLAFLFFPVAFFFVVRFEDVADVFFFTVFFVLRLVVVFLFFLVVDLRFTTLRFFLIGSPF